MLDIYVQRFCSFYPSHVFVFLKTKKQKEEMQKQVRVFVNETHLEQMLVSQVYRCTSGSDYFGKKGGKAAHSGRSRKIGTAVD